MDSEVAAVALKVLRRYLWYLTPETVVLSLCSDRVADNIKSEMTRKILSVPRPGKFEAGRSKAAVVDDEIPLSLANVIDKDSWLFSRCLMSRATSSKSTR